MNWACATAISATKSFFHHSDVTRKWITYPCAVITIPESRLAFPLLIPLEIGLNSCAAFGTYFSWQNAQTALRTCRLVFPCKISSLSSCSMLFLLTQWPLEPQLSCHLTKPLFGAFLPHQGVDPVDPPAVFPQLQNLTVHRVSRWLVRPLMVSRRWWYTFWTERDLGPTSKVGMIESTIANRRWRGCYHTDPIPLRMCLMLTHSSHGHVGSIIERF